MAISARGYGFAIRTIANTEGQDSYSQCAQTASSATGSSVAGISPRRYHSLSCLRVRDEALLSDFHRNHTPADAPPIASGQKFGSSFVESPGLK